MLLYYFEAWEKFKPLLLVFSMLSLLIVMRLGSCCLLPSAATWAHMAARAQEEVYGNLKQKLENNNMPISEINLRSK